MKAIVFTALVIAAAGFWDASYNNGVYGRALVDIFRQIRTSFGF